MIFGSLEELAAGGVPVFFPDTCILLDILRSPRRENVDAAAILAATAIRNAVVQDGTVGCVVPEQVRLELAENLPNVRTDTDSALRKLASEMKRIDAWSVALGQPSQTVVDHFRAGVPTAEQIMSDIVQASLSHASTPDITNRGFTRMMQKRTPARLGKDSTKDCVVVESYLEVAGSLRALGHTCDIVFASSNVSDFVSGTPKRLNADISTEFDALGVRYGRALHEAKHLLNL